MIKTIIEEQLVLYQFPSGNPERLGHNIYVLIDGPRALVIDTGYQQDFRQVLDDLNATGIVVTKVVPSHFHPDHVEGIFLLSRPKIYGNDKAKSTLMNFYDEEDVKSLMPQKILSNNGVITFGTFKLQLTSAPGHSDCSVVININDRYLHVGDLYMMTDQSEQVLPYVKWAGISDHILSLKQISRSECATYLLAHGQSPLTKEALVEGLDDRVKYLKAIRHSNNKISVEEALAEVSQPFVYHKWRHEIQ